MIKISYPECENLAALQNALAEGEASEFVNYSLKGLIVDLDRDVS